MLGVCPYCYSAVIGRERRLNGDDTCEKGHKYPSRLTLTKTNKLDHVIAQVKNLVLEDRDKWALCSQIVEYLNELREYHGRCYKQQGS
jgi:hypothetical protein